MNRMQGSCFVLALFVCLLGVLVCFVGVFLLFKDYKVCKCEGQQHVWNNSMYGHSCVRVSEGVYSGLDYFTCKMYFIPNRGSPEEEVFHKRCFSQFYRIDRKCIMSYFNINTLSSVGDIALYLLRYACNLLTGEVVMDINVFIQ